jgi:hypothetical protein
MSSGAQTLAARFASDAQGHPVLQDHRTQSATAIDGCKSVLFGTPFLAVGGFIEWVATNGSRAGKSVPDWLIGVIGAMFFLGGLFFFVHGLRGVARKAAWRRETSQYPNEPWRCDFRWNREGTAFSAFDDMLKRLLSAMIWTGFLVPFAWVGATQKGARIFLYGALFMGLVGLIFWYRWAKMLVDFFRYGNSFLSYDSFPYFLGGTLRARLRCPRHVSAIEELMVTLRCVEEKYVTTGTGDSRSTNVVCYELYKDVVKYDRERLTGFAGGDIPLEFRLPADGPATTLIATPPIYWEIEANGKARGVDYEAVFLVPIYKTS